MTTRQSSSVVMATCVALLSTAAAAATEKVIYDFPDGMPYGPLVLAASGKLYATTQKGGGTGSGMVFQIDQRHKTWRGKQIYAFNGDDGAAPLAGLVEDPTTGTLYGTTFAGGAYGLGVVYALAKTNKGWKQNILHTFAGGDDGSSPATTLFRDKASGVLYGVTTNGGWFGCGLVFSLNPATMAYRVLHRFGDLLDGCTPSSSLRPGPTPGTLFGTTYSGGAFDFGAVFQLTLSSATNESVIYSFGGGADGGGPVDIAVGTNAYVYGVAQTGGAHSEGAVFQLTPGNPWAFHVIYNFTAGADGSFPSGISLDDRTGLLYGVATYAGQFGHGALFQLSFDGSAWTETVLHSFTVGTDGQYPVSRPIFDPGTEQLYGVTPSGGRNGAGAAYLVTP